MANQSEEEFRSFFRELFYNVLAKERQVTVSVGMRKWRMNFFYFVDGSCIDLVEFQRRLVILGEIVGDKVVNSVCPVVDWLEFYGATDNGVQDDSIPDLASGRTGVGEVDDARESCTERMPNRLWSEYLLSHVYVMVDWWLVIFIAVGEARVKSPSPGRWRRRTQSTAWVCSWVSVVGLNEKISSCAASVCWYFHNAWAATCYSWSLLHGGCRKFA